MNFFPQWYIGSTGIILCAGPANGGRRNGVPHWPSLHQLWSLSRGVPIPRPKITQCFWQIYNKAVQVTNWNTVKVIENNHNSMQHNNEDFAQWHRVDRDHSGCGTSRCRTTYWRPPSAEPTPSTIPKSGYPYTTAQSNAVFLTGLQ